MLARGVPLGDQLVRRARGLQFCDVIKKTKRTNGKADGSSSSPNALLVSLTSPLHFISWHGMALYRRMQRLDTTRATLSGISLERPGIQPFYLSIRKSSRETMGIFTFLLLMHSTDFQTLAGRKNQGSTLL